jgi:signal transduction histidine kinase
MRPLSLRWRLLLIGGATILAAMALSTLILATLFDRHVQRVAVSDLQDQALVLISVIQPGPPPSMADQPRNPAWLRPFSGHYWQIWLADPPMRSRSLWDVTLDVAGPPPAPGRERVLTLDGPGGQRLLAVDQQVLIGQGGDAVPVRILVAEDTEDATLARAAFLRDLLPWLGASMAALLAASWAQVTLGLRPLAQIRAHLQGLTQGRRHRLGGALPAEVAPLADQLDRLLDDRDRELDRARHRAGDLAHGFKTPLQALLGDADALRDRGHGDMADSIEQVVTQMRRHVDRELARARIRTEAGTARSDPSAPVARLVKVLGRTPDGARLDWQVEVPPGTLLRIAVDDLTEALGALMENAARHARHRVRIRLQQDGAQAAVVIRDDGPGVAEEDLARLVDRGVRLDRSREGQGIGLAIASDIAEAAGGRLVLANTSPGLAAALHLPRDAG